MDKPATKESKPFTKMNNKMYDTVLPFLFQGHTPSAMILMYINRLTVGYQKEEEGITYKQFMEWTKIGSRSTISQAIETLKDLKLINVNKKGRTNTPVYSIDWEAIEAFADSITNFHTPSASPVSVPNEAKTSTVSGLHDKEKKSKEIRKEKEVDRSKDTVEPDAIQPLIAADNVIDFSDWRNKAVEQAKIEQKKLKKNKEPTQELFPPHFSKRKARQPEQDQFQMECIEL
jgi:hypothetical protein